MNLDKYQTEVDSLKRYRLSQQIRYPTLGLCGEAGEVANKVNKIYRDNDGIVTDEIKFAIADEIGDVLWYCAALASDLGLTLDAITDVNIHKLHERKRKGTMQGSGDNR